jgi:putative redox protein
MVKIEIVYQGELHCQATHGPSGATLVTDAPVDNMGKGQSFSPTDLVATALGTCILTIMGIQAQRHGVDLGGTRVSVTKEMTAVPVRRIGRLVTQVRVPVQLEPEMRQRFEAAAHACPVHRSLHPDIEAPIAFEWGAGSAQTKS